MYDIQSNTHQGPIRVVAGSNLTGKEGYLVKVTNSAGVLVADVPGAATDIAAYILAEGAVAGAMVTIIPMVAGQQYRIVAGALTFVPGDRVVAYGGTAAGQAMEYAAGAAFIAGIAEEVGDTALQYLKIRALLMAYSS
jgi:hypothetical protein